MFSSQDLSRKQPPHWLVALDHQGVGVLLGVLGKYAAKWEKPKADSCLLSIDLTKSILRDKNIHQRVCQNLCNDWGLWEL